MFTSRTPLFIGLPPPHRTERVKLRLEWGRIVWFGLFIHHTKFQLPSRPIRCLKVPGGGWVLGGVESKFSVQLRPKLNNTEFYDRSLHGSFLLFTFRSSFDWFGLILGKVSLGEARYPILGGTDNDCWNRCFNNGYGNKLELSWGQHYT